MKGQWCYFRSKLPKEYCDSLVKRSENIQYEDATIGVEGIVKDSSNRKTEVAWAFTHDYPDLHKDLWELCTIANNEWFGFHIDSLPYIQFAKYKSEKESFYNKHQDVFYLNNSPKHRKLTCVVQLTDPNEYEGGDLELFECDSYPDKNEIREQGTVIIFPSFIYHAVTPITKGIRYSAVAWFEGPNWR